MKALKLAIALVLLPLAASAAAPPHPTINELVLGDRSAPRLLQYVEIHVPPEVGSVGNYSLLQIDSSNGPSHGKVLTRIDLPREGMPNRDNLFLVANQDAAGAYQVQPGLRLNRTLALGSQTFLIVPTAGAPAEGTTLTGNENLAITDSVALLRDRSTEQAFFNAPPVEDNDSGMLGVYRIIDGRDRNMPTDFTPIPVLGTGGNFDTPGRANGSPSQMGETSRAGDNAIPVPQETRVASPPVVASSPMVWERDPARVFERSSQEGRPFVVFFGSSAVQKSREAEIAINSSGDFQVEVGKHRVNLAYVDVATDVAGQDWARKCRVLRVPTCVLYDQSGSELGRTDERSMAGFDNQVSQLIAQKAR